MALISISALLLILSGNQSVRVSIGPAGVTLQYTGERSGAAPQQWGSWNPIAPWKTEQIAWAQLERCTFRETVTGTFLSPEARVSFGFGPWPVVVQPTLEELSVERGRKTQETVICTDTAGKSYLLPMTDNHTGSGLSGLIIDGFRFVFGTGVYVISGDDRRALMTVFREHLPAGGVNEESVVYGGR